MGTKQVYQNYNFHDGATLTGLPTPSAASDAAPKSYVDNTVNGLSPKDSVRAATTAAGTLASSFENGDTIDGVVLATNDRILIKNQASGSENGVYTVNASGAPTRALDFDASSEIRGAVIPVEEGTTNGDTRWICTTDAPITVGSTALSFTNTGGNFTAGSGITLTGNAFSISAATGILAGGGIDTAVVVRKYAANVGDNAASTFNIDHNLATLDVTVAVYQIIDGAQVDVAVTTSTTNRVILDFGSTVPTSAQFRVVVHG